MYLSAATTRCRAGCVRAIGGRGKKKRKAEEGGLLNQVGTLQTASWCWRYPDFSEIVYVQPVLTLHEHTYFRRTKRTVP